MNCSQIPVFVLKKYRVKEPSQGPGLLGKVQTIKTKHAIVLSHNDVIACFELPNPIEHLTQFAPSETI